MQRAMQTPVAFKETRSGRCGRGAIGWSMRFNNNMPFDQFTIEQLAGDLLPDATPEQRLATGFNRNHMHNSEGGRIAEETRVENVFDRAETTGTVWLGLTLQCARCHDHKFDPTSNPRLLCVLRFLQSDDQKMAAQIASPRFLRPSTTTPPTPDAVKVMVMDTRHEPRDTFVLVKGIYNDVTDRKVTAMCPACCHPCLPQPAETGITDSIWPRWIVSPDHPLTARVTVNRFWQTFFGRGIVSTPYDFGLQGHQPTHPGSARLAGRRIHRIRLERETSASR